MRRKRKLSPHMQDTTSLKAKLNSCGTSLKAKLNSCGTSLHVPSPDSSVQQTSLHVLSPDGSVQQTSLHVPSPDGSVQQTSLHVPSPDSSVQQTSLHVPNLNVPSPDSSVLYLLSTHAQDQCMWSTPSLRSFTDVAFETRLQTVTMSLHQSLNIVVHSDSGNALVRTTPTWKGVWAPEQTLIMDNSPNFSRHWADFSCFFFVFSFLSFFSLLVCFVRMVSSNSASMLAREALHHSSKHPYAWWTLCQVQCTGFSKTLSVFYGTAQWPGTR